MPRKTKDNEEKEIKQKTNTSSKKSTTKKTTSKSPKTSTTAKKTTTKKASSKSPKTSTSTKVATKKTTAKKTTPRKKKEYLAEYYDLPFKYNKTVVKLLAQTPDTLFVYWEISDDDRKKFAKKFGDNFFETSTPILKIFNKTRNYIFEIEINDFANCWYIHVDDSKCDYQIELDRKLNNSSNEYIYVSSSNDIIAPNDHILFEQNLSNVQFKNVKTNAIKTVAINKDFEKIYNIKKLRDLLYKEEMNSISNPSSTFK